MVTGHTLDALLSPAARLHPLGIAYWKARGLTAPLFLLVAGWAVTVAIRRAPARGLGLVAERLPRVLLLLLVGVVLRWPGWGLAGLRAGDPAVWGHLLGFDALHAIAVAFLVSAVVFALGRPAREERLLFALLVVLAVALGMRAPAPLPEPLPAGLPALALTQALGGTSPFPLFPWTGYFFTGCLVGLQVGDGSRRGALGLLWLGAALVLAPCGKGIATAPPGQPALIAFRVGAILLLLAALSAVPGRLAAVLAPLGRLSLVVYALHLPVVYGWSTVEGLASRVGPRLGAGPALGVALLLLLAAAGLAWLLAAGLRRLARLVAAGRAALQRASAAR
jgi:hypothetical protein